MKKKHKEYTNFNFFFGCHVKTNNQKKV